MFGAIFCCIRIDWINEIMITKSFSVLIGAEIFSISWKFILTARLRSPVHKYFWFDFFLNWSIFLAGHHFSTNPWMRDTKLWLALEIVILRNPLGQWWMPGHEPFRVPSTFAAKLNTSRKRKRPPFVKAARNKSHEWYLQISVRHIGSLTTEPHVGRKCSP